MIIRLAPYLLVAMLVFSSCEEGENPTIQSVRFFNYLDSNIDTVKVYVSYYFGYLEFLNIESDSVSTVLQATDLDSECFFKLSLNDTIIERRWSLPSRSIDPTQPITFPHGSYTFGVFESDSSIESIFIGLIEFKRGLQF